MAAQARKPYTKLGGALFQVFHKKKDLVNKHWMDTNTHKYYETVERIVVPAAMNIAREVPGYPQRVQKLLSYTNPAFSDVWNFNVELIYRMVADKDHQTEENCTKMYLLRAVMDVLFTMSAVFDDYSDKSERRMGKEAWHLVCEGGEGAAIYDAAFLSFLPLVLLKQRFSRDPGYVGMLEAIATGNLKMLIGQTLDVVGHSNMAPTMDDYIHINNYKAAQFVNIGPALALRHAGISSPEIIDKTMEVFRIMGHLIQIWDDFVDYYGTTEQTGKPSCDARNAGTTWVSAMALSHFTPSQKEEFKEIYGSQDPVKVSRLLGLYDEIDLPGLYLELMIQNYNKCKELIDDIPHRKVQNACLSYLEWLLGPSS